MLVQSMAAGESSFLIPWFSEETAAGAGSGVQKSGALKEVAVRESQGKEGGAVLKKEKQAPSIKFSMIFSIVLGVLLPLFIALLVLCALLQRATASSTMEAYQMMFDQNVRAIDSAILQSNYASSAMITYTENNQLLKDYYQATNEYDRSVAMKKIQDMIGNSDITNLGGFGGKLMILMKDGYLISSEKAVNIGTGFLDTAWMQKVHAGKAVPYWDTEIGKLFHQENPEDYVTYARELTHYGKNVYGYALMSIPTTLFTNFQTDARYQKGDLFMFSADGRLLSGTGEHYKEQELQALFADWLQQQSQKLHQKPDAKQKLNDQKGRGDYYVMGSALSSSQNYILYVGNRHAIFERSEQIIWYLELFMLVITVLSIAITWSISQYITKPILFLSDKIQKIEQSAPQDLVLEHNRFKETRELEEGMLRAQERIQRLLEEVREEAKMKEKARFDSLKAQIKPHFLFNTLNAIRWKASINGDEEVADILSNLGVLLSETYKNDHEMETIGNAIYTLEAYVKIMEIRFGNKVEFFCVIPEELKNYQIPRFCLQPLVENSFIHGMSKAEEGTIVLRGEKAGQDIELTLIDNGEGLNGKTIDLSVESGANKRGITGIGLSNIHRRIRMLYGPGYGLKVDTDVEMGFRISLRIPAEMSEEQDESIDRRG